jgi:ubiquinone/menaquinone biosynthesis C-methylase UbiE
MKKDSYKRFAKYYDAVFGPLNSGLRGIGLKMYPPREGMSVLDVGCGTGIHLELYQKAGCKVFGIDLSPGMIRVARDRLGEDANLFLGDASNMPYENDEFELVMMMTVLHEMPAGVRSAVINESKRVLKTDGRILLIDFHPGPIRTWKGWLSKSIITLAEISGGPKHFKNYRHFIASNGLPALISAHGLSVDTKKIVAGGTMGLFLLQKDA